MKNRIMITLLVVTLLVVTLACGNNSGVKLPPTCKLTTFNNAENVTIYRMECSNKQTTWYYGENINQQPLIDAAWNVWDNMAISQKEVLQNDGNPKDLTDILKGK